MICKFVHTLVCFKTRKTLEKLTCKEKIKDTINQSLNVGGDAAGGSLSSNSNVGQQVYTPQLNSYKSTQFYFDYNNSFKFPRSFGELLWNRAKR